MGADGGGMKPQPTGWRHGKRETPVPKMQAHVFPHGSKLPRDKRSEALARMEDRPLTRRGDLAGSAKGEVEERKN